MSTLNQNFQLANRVVIGNGVFGPQSRIEEKCRDLDGDTGFLSRQTVPSTEVDGFGGSKGCFADYEYGSINYTTSTGAYAISSEIYFKWISIGGSKS